ncbi:MAG: flagellar basal-body MS-ring/collar protein FliF [Gammaproteobacteria bacterium]|nr:flagellar basal-body MS-ring/collar protein FliF [Gammaproteobacteria bacterium]MCW9005890.1 flagellar basal-body MS-ring/collar protein FliF [Gammaproteobacteria bacterium]MCW9056733.1 flagellar basal-body MS-ring/collar protein FliF [Gammaproteobacteria bacterium]
MSVSASYGFSSLPVPRQIGLLVGLAGSVALAIWLAMWAAQPDFTSLYSGLEARDATEVVSALQAAAIPHKLDQSTGAVMVPPGRIHEARLKLAAQGLPKGTGVGVEVLQEEQSFGTSQFVEGARYHHAIETELARTITTMRNVKSARVHLAIPKRSVFVRNRENPSASVALNLYGGRSIDQEQVNAITHMVASSISNLSVDNITVVDQSGRLLTSGDGAGNVAMTGKQYEYRRQLEMDYAKSIERLLEPIVGLGKVRSTVNADIDFTEEESTEEIFNPQRQSVRSEQSSETASFGGQDAGGVPGALSNQPPQGGTLVPGAGGLDGMSVDSQKPLNSSKNAVRNYELDRTIRHTRQGAGNIKRLTVGVLVDDRTKVSSSGAVERTPLTDEELKRIITLVQQTIGYNEARGDQVNVINASFADAEVVEDLPEETLLEQTWVRNLGKQLLAGIIILVLIFAVFKPTVKNLAAYKPPPPPALVAGEGGAMGQLEHQDRQKMPSGQDDNVDFAKAMVDHDPGRVANVVKEWVANET